MRAFNRLIAASFALALTLGSASALAAPGYKVVRSVSLGAPDRWDYVSFQQGARRVFVAHGDRLSVVDSASGAVLGEVDGLTGGSHGIAFVPALGKGYSDDGKTGVAHSFDLATLKLGRAIKADVDADGVGFDRASGHIFVINGDPGTLTMIDPRTDRPVATVATGANLEFGVSNDRGHIFVNGETGHDIVVVDTRANRVVAHWPMPGCLSPHGLALDRVGRRLFSSCANGVMVVLDADSGRVLSTLPIGQGSDAVVYDPKRRQAISANGGSGDLTIVRDVGRDHFVVAATVKTAATGRTLAIDPDSGTLYLAAAEPDPNGPSTGHRKIVPGSLQLLMLAPVHPARCNPRIETDAARCRAEPAAASSS